MERIRPSDNGHFLVTASGDPFFWLGDTAWDLIHRCTPDQVEMYFTKRAHQGFTVIQAVALAERDGLRTPSALGELPFTDLESLRPNEAYFDWIDRVIEMAERAGLYLCLLPTWGDKVNQASGTGPQIFTETSIQEYGEYVGRRFARHDNLIWMIGGDRAEIQDGVDYRPVWRALARGVRAHATQLMTYHPKGDRGSSREFHDDDWLDLNTWQSSHSDLETRIHDWIYSDWVRTPAKPTLDSEPCYEEIDISLGPGNGGFTPYDVRRRVYRSVFAGGCGVTYGHSSVWQMYDTDREPMFGARLPWHHCLDALGATQMHHLKELMLSRPYLTRVPDQALVAATNDPLVRATRDEDGTYAMIYMPHASREVTIDLRRLSGSSFLAQWFDPRTGGLSEIGTFAREDEPTIACSWRGPDWVVVIDRRSGS